MSLQLQERLGVQVPQIVHRPVDVVSLAAAEEAIELANAYGICRGWPLDESQQFTLRVALGERADKSWAAATIGDFEPRQNGKNDTCNARELAGLLLFKERLLIHTAHLFDTANEAFLRMVEIFENWDDLRKKVARIRYANGEQGIELLTGQRLKYKARSGAAGRGFAEADLTVYDEAQHLQAEHVAASGPARLANPNSQGWYMGSGGLVTSLNAWRMRKRALAGDGGRFAYVEHTAEQVSVVGGRVESVKPHVLDREAWARANPAYGSRITDESLLSLYEELGPDLFSRECLCLWDPDPAGDGSPIPSTVWDLVCDPDVAPSGSLTFGLDVNLERTAGAIGVESAGGDIELIAHIPAGGLVARAAEINKRQKAPCWAVDGSSTAPIAAYVPDLKQAGLKIEEVPAADVAAACGRILKRVSESRVRVRRHASLDEAVRGLIKRNVGDAWRWDRRAGVDISPFMAVTVADWFADRHRPVKAVVMGSRR